MANLIYATTPVANYALGRNCSVALQFNSIDEGASFKTVTIELCISQGQVSMDTDTIEIPSNCQAGWKVKLPGLISGTVTGTGYVASSNVLQTGEVDPSVPLGPLDILQFLGQPVAVSIKANTDIVQSGAIVYDQPFQLTATTNNAVNGFFKASNVTISPDDAVKLDFTIELSGAQNLVGFVAIADGVSS